MALAYPLGSSMGGSDAAHVDATRKFVPKARVARIYQSMPTKIASDLGLLQAVNWMRATQGEVWVSFTQMPSDAVFVAVLVDWAASGVKFRWTYKHEPENPTKHNDPAKYRTDWSHLLNQYHGQSAVLQGRVSPQTILMAYTLDPHSGRNPEDWYVPNVSTLGFDCYVLANAVRIEQYAAKKGKHYSIPEFGSGGTDDHMELAYLEALLKLWQANPPVGAAYFNATGTGGSAPLAVLPLTRARLASLM
jgi:hypothetical protein